MPDHATQQPESLVPEDGGLEPGGSAQQPSRSGADLVDAAASGTDAVRAFTPAENDDLVAYFLAHDGLPGDKKLTTVTVTLGHGATAKPFRCEIHPVEWSEWQDARERATDKATGMLDAYVSASWTVARALASPQLGPVISRMQSQFPDSAPADAAELLRRMFAKQSGALLELSAKVLELSKLQGETQSVKEVEAAKN